MTLDIRSIDTGEEIDPALKNLLCHWDIKLTHK